MPTTKTVHDAAGLAGVFPALFTPLLDDDPKRLRNGIDYEKTKRMIDDLVEAGVDGIVPVGTTGQSPTVSNQQQIDFIRFTAEYLDGRLPIIAGAGSNCTRESVEMIAQLQRHLGTLAVLCVTGYYNNPPQEGLFEHFTVLSRETGAKIVLYNVPGRSASYLEPDTLVALADDENVIGVKQAVDFVSPGRYRDDTLDVIARTSPDRFAVLSGEDDAFPAILDMGGVGIVSATANVPEAARLFRTIMLEHRAGNVQAVAAAQESLLPFVQAVFCRKNPIPLGVLFNSPLYLPLVPVERTVGGDEAKASIMKLVGSAASSLRKYHA